MSWLRVLAGLFTSSLALLSACAPVPEPREVIQAEAPCREDRDCEIARNESPVQQARCGNGIASSGARGDLQKAVCGPIGNMTLKAPEPVLACFRGTCVPIGSQR